MAFMFGRGRRASSAAAAYTGSRLPGEGGSLGQWGGNLSGELMKPKTVQSLGLPGGSPGGITSRANYGPVLEARRQAKLAAADPGLSTRGRIGAPGRGARPVSGGLEGRGIRPSAGSRAAGRPVKTGGPVPSMSRMSASEFGGGMGMGIPSGAARGGHNIPMLGRMPSAAQVDSAAAMGIPANAARGSQNIPMLARPDATGLNVRRNIAASQRARAGAAAERESAAALRYGSSMGNMGIPANAARGSQNIPMLARPDAVGLNVRRNVAASQAVRAEAQKARDTVAGARSISDSLKSRSKALTNATVTPVKVRGLSNAEKVVKETVEKDKGKNIEKLMAHMKGNTKAYAIGAGVIGLGALLHGREKRGTSSGAHGMYR